MLRAEEWVWWVTIQNFVGRALLLLLARTGLDTGWLVVFQPHIMKMRAAPAGYQLVTAAPVIVIA
jgi:hypothetical protein